MPWTALSVLSIKLIRFYHSSTSAIKLRLKHNTVGDVKDPLIIIVHSRHNLMNQYYYYHDSVDGALILQYLLDC